MQQMIIPGKHIIYVKVLVLHMSIKSERYLVDLGGGKLRKLKKNEGLKIWVENWEKAEAARERRYADAHPRRTYVWSPGLFGLLIITLLRGNTYSTNTNLQITNTHIQNHKYWYPIAAYSFRLSLVLSNRENRYCKSCLVPRASIVVV